MKWNKLHSPALAGPPLCPEDLGTQMVVDKGKGRQEAAHSSKGKAGSCDWKRGVGLTSSASCFRDDTDHLELCAHACAPAASKKNVTMVDTIIT